MNVGLYHVAQLQPSVYRTDHMSLKKATNVLKKSIGYSAIACTKNTQVYLKIVLTMTVNSSSNMIRCSDKM